MLYNRYIDEVQCRNYRAREYFLYRAAKRSLRHVVRSSLRRAARNYPTVRITRGREEGREFGRSPIPSNFGRRCCHHVGVSPDRCPAANRDMLLTSRRGRIAATHTRRTARRGVSTVCISSTGTGRAEPPVAEPTTQQTGIAIAAACSDVRTLSTSPANARRAGARAAIRKEI